MVRGKLAYLCAACTLPRRPVCPMRPIPARATIAVKLSTQRRRCSSQPASHHPQRLARRDTTRDLLALNQRQVSTRSVANSRAHPSRSFHERSDRPRRPPKPTPDQPVRLGGLPPIPHLGPLSFTEHRHNNLLNKRQRLSLRVLPSPPETTPDMSAHDGRDEEAYTPPKVRG